MGIQKFENIITWQKAQDLAIEIYTVQKLFVDLSNL